jgi:dephospho-CoA kinase
MKAKHLWGLTGGIGSGKSTVAKLLQARGATIVDADAHAKALTQAGGRAMPAIAAEWGDAMINPDGSMNRDAMRALVFNSTEAKTRLEALLHPLIGQATQEAIHAATTPWVFCDVPLLVESAHWRLRLEGVWVVDCLVSTQMQRVALRNGWDNATIESVIAKQAPRAQRIAAADVVTFNDGLTLAELSELVAAQCDQVGLR